MEEEPDAHICIYIREGGHELHADIYLELNVLLEECMPEVVTKLLATIHTTTH